MYSALRAAAECEQGAGYMIHEGGRWSDIHGCWFFMPRKLSREPYDEVKDAAKCVNLMLACTEPPAADGSNVAMQECLDFRELRGCSVRAWRFRPPPSPRFAVCLRC
jgi:soluble calcium-activated nucleotidase 1